mgnify:CR=1 FL=1
MTDPSIPIQTHITMDRLNHAHVREILQEQASVLALARASCIGTSVHDRQINDAINVARRISIEALSMLEEFNTTTAH